MRAARVQPVLVGSRLKVTVSPDDAVAVGVYVPPMAPVVGPVKVIVWLRTAPLMVVATCSFGAG